MSRADRKLLLAGMQKQLDVQSCAPVSAAVCSDETALCLVPLAMRRHVRLAQQQTLSSNVNFQPLSDDVGKRVGLLAHAFAAVVP